MDYKEKYEEALERARHYYLTGKGEPVDFIKMIFPEIEESEDERTRKELIEFLKLPHSRFVGKRDHEKWIAWLEKQSEQEKKNFEFKASDWYVSKVDGKIHNIYQSVDKAEPKFKAGDWIVDNKTPNDVFCVIEVLEEIYKVIDIDGDDYHIPHCKADKQFHLWTIQDAKDGDVLVTSPEKGSESNEQIFLFKAINSRDYVDDCIEYYFRLCDGVFYENTIGYMGTILDTFYPATKEQRDLLFQKMEEAEYEWDADKKELKRMEVSSKESEDERIKQEILELVSISGNGSQFEEIKDWLEKEGEKKSVDEVLKIRQELYQSGYNDGYKHGQEDIAKSLEKKSGDEELKGITQWMPMPEPPKKGGEQ